MGQPVNLPWSYSCRQVLNLLFEQNFLLVDATQDFLACLMLDGWIDGWTDVICCWNSVSCFLSSTSKSFRTMLLKSDMMCRNVQIISVVTQKFYGSCSFPLNKICCSMVINPCLFYKKALDRMWHFWKIRCCC